MRLSLEMVSWNILMLIIYLFISNAGKLKGKKSSFVRF